MMRIAILFFSLGSGLFSNVLLGSHVAWGQQTSSPSGTYFPGVEESQLGEKLKSRVLLEEHNCVACHTTKSESLANASKQAPRLVDVGGRTNPHRLATFIGGPHQVKPGTTMPDVLAHLGKEEKSRTATAIAHFLASVAKSKFQPVVPDKVAAEFGEKLFHTRGCVACHSPRDSSGKETMADVSTPLGDLTHKYNVNSLSQFLTDPHRVRPSGRMPNLRLPGREVRQIAHYLLRETKVPGHLKYTLIRGRVWEGLEVNVDRERAGHVDDFDLKKIDRLPHNSALIYEGFLKSDGPDEAEFFFEMNGGDLLINDKSVVSLQASNRRGVKKVQGRAVLVKGWNKVKLTYYHTGRNPSLKFEMATPTRKRAPIAAEWLSISAKPIEPYRAFEVDESLVANGKLAFAQNGCVNCHEDVAQHIPQNLLATIEKPASLAELKADAGCLMPAKEAKVSTAVPRMNLSEKQKAAIRSILPAVDQQKLDEQSLVNKTLVSFNCLSCHQRKGLGGVSAQRNQLFEGDKTELGNDGRIPPPLTLVGAKLQKTYLSDVLLRGARRRPYLATTMPQFGESNIGHLVDLFGKIDHVEPVEFEKITDIKRVKAAGHKLMGTTGFSCIGCHNFNGQKAAGPGALEIVDSTSRLKKDWFYHFMLKPDRFRKGTIMPESWPGGHVFMDDVLDGDLKKQIESLWVYLEDGRRAKNPIGLSRKSPELRVTDEAVICRGRGTAGYRGMGVGYPEGVHLAFDTQEMNLRLLWKGEFANVDNGRFSARGRDRISFPAGIPFHRLKSLEDNWPYKRKTDYLFPQDQGYRFRGYQLDKLKRPTLLYQYGEVSVEDFFEDKLDANKSSYFERTITFDAPQEQAEFYFRAASGKKIQKIDDTTYKIDRLTLTFKGAEKAVVREGDPGELLLSVKLGKGKSKLVVEYKW